MEKKKKLILREWLEENYKNFPRSEITKIEIIKTGIARKVKKGGIESIMTRLSNIMIYGERELRKHKLFFVKDIDNSKRESREEIGYLCVVR